MRFYPVSKRGGPLRKPLLPWKPKQAEESKNRKMYFKMESEHGLLYTIKLRRNQNLFSKAVAKRLPSHDLNCLFSGKIVGDDKSSVGMNLCTGVVSLQLGNSLNLF